MTSNEIINKISAEILHQTDADGIRRCVSMAFVAGLELGHKDHCHSRRIAAYDSNGNFIREYSSAREAARVMMGSYGNISKSARDGKWKAYDFYWKYINE